MRFRGSVTRWGRPAIALVLALPLAGLVIFERTGTVAAANINIPISGIAYQGPNGNGDVTIVVGTTLTWTNNDPFSHSAVSDALPPVFDTGTIAPGTTSPMITFNIPGTFKYHCAFHPSSMKGTITVVGGPPPTVSSVTPASGRTTGGAIVTITGTNFQNGATVSFGGVPATNVMFVDSGTLKAVLPPHTAGIVDVTVTNPDTGVGAGTGLFTFSDVIALPAARALGPPLGNPNPLPNGHAGPAPSGGPPNPNPPHRSLTNTGIGPTNAEDVQAPDPVPPPR